MPQTKSECTDAIFTLTSAPIESLASRERPCMDLWAQFHTNLRLIPVSVPIAVIRLDLSTLSSNSPILPARRLRG